MSTNTERTVAADGMLTPQGRAAVMLDAAARETAKAARALMRSVQSRSESRTTDAVTLRVAGSRLDELEAAIARWDDAVHEALSGGAR